MTYYVGKVLRKIDVVRTIGIGELMKWNTLPGKLIFGGDRLRANLFGEQFGDDALILLSQKVVGHRS
jgi:hypothetical protein